MKGTAQMMMHVCALCQMHTSAASDAPNVDRKALVEPYKHTKGLGMSAAADDVNIRHPRFFSASSLHYQQSTCTGA